MEQVNTEVTEEPKKELGAYMLMGFLIILFAGVGAYYYVMNDNAHTQLSALQNQNATVNETQIFNSGVIASAMQIVKLTDACQVASIKYSNVTRDLVDLQCVKDLLSAQNITLKAPTN